MAEKGFRSGKAILDFGSLFLTDFITLQFFASYPIQQKNI